MGSNRLPDEVSQGLAAREETSQVHQGTDFLRGGRFRRDPHAMDSALLVQLCAAGNFKGRAHDVLS